MAFKNEKAKIRARLLKASLYLVMGVGAREPKKAYRIAEAALKGGVDILQLRDYSLNDSQLLAAAKEFRKLTRHTKTLFIVNNRPDIARLSQADGVHVGQDDLSVAQARAIVGKGKIVGASTHRLPEAKRANKDRVDYIGVGPIYATPTKAGRQPVSLEYIRQVAEMKSSVPFFAIGGIDLSNLEQVLDAGAKRIAVVRAIVDASDPQKAASDFKKSMENHSLASNRP